MLLSAYDSASSVSSSSLSDDDNKKRELPSPFEDDGDHAGETSLEHVNKRIRRIPHIEGNYACTIFLPCQSTEGEEDPVTVLQQGALQQAAKLWPGREWVKVANESVHCSLSRTVMLKHHLIAPFKRKITDQLRCKPQFTMYVSPSNVELFLSEDRTTAFLASPIVEPGPVVTMISAVDEIMGEFDLEKFYQPPKAHLSLAWTTIDVEGLCQKVESLAEGEQHFKLPSMSIPANGLIGIDVVSAVLRIGKENTIINLSD